MCVLFDALAALAAAVVARRVKREDGIGGRWQGCVYACDGDDDDEGGSRFLFVCGREQQTRRSPVVVCVYVISREN